MNTYCRKAGIRRLLIAPDYRMPSPKPDHFLKKKVQLFVGIQPFPVQPGNLIILTIGIIISKTCVSKFVPGKKHRGSPAAHQRYTGIFHHFKTKSANLRIFRFSLRSAVPAPIIIMSVRIVPPIVFIVFSIIGIEVPE